IINVGRPGVPPAAPRIPRPAAKCVRRCGRRSAPTIETRLIRHSRFLALHAECILFGIANWGPHERHAVAFEADVPFEIRRLFVMDTVRETLKELPFRCEKGVLSTRHCAVRQKPPVLIAMRNADHCWPSLRSPAKANRSRSGS
ncbi:MAG: hypothetical protein V8T86_07915, partial [Victivallis sp.]